MGSSVPSRAPRACPRPLCPNNQPCSVHGTGRQWETPRPRVAYRTPAGGETATWPRDRARVLREEPECRLCGAPATQVDHIVPLAQGGSRGRENLQAICAWCHRGKTGREGNKAR
jgi:5-methylcytosine-specific restriction protein A